jgi:hypothetical protein
MTENLENESIKDNAYNEGFKAAMLAKARKYKYFRLAFWLSIAVFCIVIISVALYVSSLHCEDLIKCGSNLPTFANSSGG